VEYNKLADDTSLHIKYTAVTAIHFSSSTNYYFGRWWVDTVLPHNTLYLMLQLEIQIG